MQRTALATKARVESEQGPPSAVVPIANRLTGDGIRTTLDKLTRSHRHHATTIIGASQRSRRYNAGTITGDASPITDPGPASLGNGSQSVVIGTSVRPSRDPSTGEGSRPASLPGGPSHPPDDRPSPGSVPARGPLVAPEGCHVGVSAFLAAWPLGEMNLRWLDPAPRRAARSDAALRSGAPPIRSDDPSSRPARRIGRAGSEEGGVIAGLVIGLVVIGLVATLGLSGALHEVVVLGRAGWHATAGWSSTHRPTVGAGGGG